MLCIVKYTWLLFRGHGHRQAAGRVWHERFRRKAIALNLDEASYGRDSEEELGIDETGYGGIRQASEEGWGIDGWWLWSMVAFIVGAVTQGVKLFACKGIPWTRFLVAVWLTSFLIMEYFRVMGSKADPRGVYAATTAARNIDTAMRRFQGFVLAAGLTIQCLVWTWIVSPSLHDLGFTMT